MNQDKINHYVDKLANGIQASNGGISFKGVVDEFNELITNDKEFRDIFEKKRLSSMKNACKLLEEIIDERNIKYYNNKILPNSVFDVDQIFTICLSEKKHNEIIDLLITAIDHSTQGTLTINDKTDLANCIYSVVLATEIDSINGGYRWYTNDCEKHKNKYNDIFENAVFTLSNTDTVLYGFDGYIWKNRNELDIPNGIPGTFEYLCSCYPSPTFDTTKEYWEERKKQYKKDQKEQIQRDEENLFRIKYLNDTNYCFQSEKEYKIFKKKIFNDSFIKYRYQSLTTYFYRSKIFLEDKNIKGFDLCIKKMLEVSVSYSSKKKFFSDILKLLSNNKELFDKYSSIFAQYPKK